MVDIIAKFLFISVISGFVSGALMMLSIHVAFTFPLFFQGFIFTSISAPVVMFSAALLIQRRFKRDYTIHILAGFVLMSGVILIDALSTHGRDWIDFGDLHFELFMIYPFRNLVAALVCYFISRFLLKR